MRDGIIINPKSNIPDTEYASDDLVDKISEEIEEKYAEALKLLAEGPNS